MSDLFIIACERMAKGKFHWETDPGFVALVDASYVPDYLAHMTYADIPKSAVLLAPTAFSLSPTVVEGWCVDPMAYATQFGPAPAIHAVVVMQALPPPDIINPLVVEPEVPPPVVPPDDQLGLVAYIDQGYNFNQSISTQMALYIIWPGQGIFRP